MSKRVGEAGATTAPEAEGRVLAPAQNPEPIRIGFASTQSRRASTGAGVHDSDRFTIELLRKRITELDAALIGMYQRLVALENSTIWRATSVLRRTLGHIPPPMRHGLRKVASPRSWAASSRRMLARTRRATPQTPPVPQPVRGAAADAAAYAALAEIEAKHRAYPGNYRLRDELERRADALYISAWNRAVEVARRGEYAGAQDVMRRACQAMTAALQRPERLPTSPIRRVAVVGIHSVPQCLLYRVEQKVDHLRAAGYEVGLYDSDRQMGQFLTHIYKYDAVIFYRIPAHAISIVAIHKAKELGLTTFYDIDDMIFDEEFYPPSFESFRGLLPIDDYISVTLSTPVYRHAMSLCDYGIASTTALAREMEKVVGAGRVFLHHNAFGLKHERLAPRSLDQHDRDQVTIFYGSATRAHKEDFQDLVEPALVEMVRRHGERVKIVLVGFIAPSKRLEEIEDNLELIEHVADVEEYWALLRRADINLAVLKPTVMAHCKSEIKWMEAAMFGIPSVVSGTETYREVIEPGITGLICDTPEEWTEALDVLVRDTKLRHRIGREAWRRVHERYGIPAMAQNVQRILERATRNAVPTEQPTVLIVNVFYPPQIIGGATRVAHDNATTLASSYSDDFHIEVFTSAIGDHDCHLFCYTQSGTRVTALMRPQWAELETRIEDNQVALIFADLVDRINPSLIHFHCIQRLTPNIVEVARGKKIPYLITVHDGYWISDYQFIIDPENTPRLYDYADPLAVIASCGKAAYDRMMKLRTPLFGATKVLAVSKKFAELYSRCGVPNVIAIENGISELAPVTRTMSPDGRVRLAMIGGMNRFKGFHLVEDALKSTAFSRLSLTVIDYDMPPDTRRDETWNTTPVAILPKVPEERVTELYAEVDVLLAPSVWPESFGLVTREALQCGCWIVASDRGSVADCVTEGENGHIIDVSDERDLIRVLQLIDDNPERYWQMPPRPELRRARDQVDELAALYRCVLSNAELPANEARCG